MILYCKSSEKIIVNLSDVHEEVEDIHFKNTSSLDIEFDKKFNENIDEHFVRFNILMRSFMNSCNFRDIFYDQFPFIDISSIYLHYSISKMNALKDKSFRLIKVDNESVDIFPLISLKDNKRMNASIYLGMRRVNNVNIYFLAFMDLDDRNDFILIPVDILNKFILDNVFGLNVWSCDHHCYSHGDSRPCIRFNDLLINFHKKLYSFYKTGKWECDDGGCVSVKILNNEFIKYSNFCVFWRCHGGDNMFMRGSSLLGVDSFHDASSFNRNTSTSNFYTSITHSVSTGASSVRPNHFVHFIASFNESFDTLKLLSFNNLSFYGYIHNYVSVYDYCEFYRKSTSNIRELKGVKNIEIKHVLPHINSYNNYGNSCWFVCNVVDFAYQITLLTADNFRLTSSIESIMTKNMFVATRIMIRNLVCFAYSEMTGDVIECKNISIESALNSKLVKYIESGEYKSYFTLLLNGILKRYDDADNYINLCHFMFFDSFECDDLRYDGVIDERYLSKLIAILKVLSIGYNIPYSFTINNSSIKLHELNKNIAFKINSNNKRDIAYDMFGDLLSICEYVNYKNSSFVVNSKKCENNKLINCNSFVSESVNSVESNSDGNRHQNKYVYISIMIVFVVLVSLCVLCLLLLDDFSWNFYFIQMIDVLSSSGLPE